MSGRSRHDVPIIPSRKRYCRITRLERAARTLSPNRQKVKARRSRLATAVKGGDTGATVFSMFIHAERKPLTLRQFRGVYTRVMPSGSEKLTPILWSLGYNRCCTLSGTGAQMYRGQDNSLALRRANDARDRLNGGRTFCEVRR
jgi:hypothetical protein